MCVFMYCMCVGACGSQRVPDAPGVEFQMVMRHPTRVLGTKMESPGRMNSKCCQTMSHLSSSQTHTFNQHPFSLGDNNGET